jgi:hypothetical protein
VHARQVVRDGPETEPAVTTSGQLYLDLVREIAVLSESAPLCSSHGGRAARSQIVRAAAHEVRGSVQPQGGLVRIEANPVFSEGDNGVA